MEKIMANYYRLCYITPSNKCKIKYFDDTRTGIKYGIKLKKRKDYTVLGLSKRDNKTGIVTNYWF